MTMLIGGTGLGGQSTIEIAQHLGLEYVIFDDKNPEADYNFVADIDFKGIDQLVVSSGFHFDHPVIVAAEKLGVPIINEIGFALQHKITSAKVILVTGTNGKTTVTRMINALLNGYGLKSAVCGNIGVKMSEVVFDQQLDYLVVEIGSIHLHFIDQLQVEVGVITNIAPDHINFHGSFENYKNDKLKIAPWCRAVVCDIETTPPQAVPPFRTKGNVYYGFGAPKVGEIGLVEELIVSRIGADAGNATEMLDLNNEFGFDINRITISNLLASLGVIGILVDSPDAKLHCKILQNFQLDPSRAKTIKINYAGSKRVFVQDSKGTNPHATTALISSFPEKSVIWITGGDTKGNDFRELYNDLEPFVSDVIVSSNDLEHFKKFFDGLPNIHYVSNPDKTEILEQSIGKSLELSPTGSKTIVFSPATASFDLYKNYLERGEIFESILQGLDGYTDLSKGKLEQGKLGE
jgi:UDP-N-acetylmuramoylalanine--D-glutamate ligase